jgi:hypothetical protein
MHVAIVLYHLPAPGTCCAVYSIQQRRAMLQLQRTHLQTHRAAGMYLRVCVIAEALVI